MDQRPRYEQLIAGKLESLPLPDMQDAIWARVKARLDIDLPSDDDGGGDGPAPKPGPGIIGWGLSVVLIAFLSFYFLKKDPQNNILPASTPTNSNPFTSSPAQGEGPPGTVPAQNRDNPSVTVPIQPGNEDTVLMSAPPGQASVGAVSNDTIAISQPGNDLAGLANVPELKNDSVIPKKKKGVSLKDEDYRIVPKKEDNR